MNLCCQRPRRLRFTSKDILSHDRVYLLVNTGLHCVVNEVFVGGSCVIVRLVNLRWAWRNRWTAWCVFWDVGGAESFHIWARRLRHPWSRQAHWWLFERRFAFIRRIFAWVSLDQRVAKLWFIFHRTQHRLRLSCWQNSVLTYRAARPGFRRRSWASIIDGCCFRSFRTLVYAVAAHV